MKTALLISTYNWPEALNLVLKSVKIQSIPPDEILIADDGSTEETTQVVQKYKNLGLPIKHVWQEDKGFRKTSILNKAIAKSTSDYIIQTDGDCILHKDFVKDHINNSKKSTFQFGSRVNIQENHLQEVFQVEKISYNFFARGIKKRTRNLRIPFLTNFYKQKNELSKKVRGCNLSFWRNDFIDINGYNEDMTGWGQEDSEMVVRLLNKGVDGRRLRYAGIVYHIWHKENSKEKSGVNRIIQQKAMDGEMVSCKNGIEKYL
ncbi:glycosyltransferase family 2 protein [Autumnicola psychrophila]|uniref:Glycosyltransferase family 2 protein n=1 Tax=Autumnicola psychrophila TaxID=3075592 RepID=A0ABU3DVI0_9FLAO|nr:glycosyltransferase family 2 protein [Zunongwangia sp. F225]MDT0687087.1 glycosyltransferase family 2 protein [Zunongwangia sp. F225]